MNKLQMVGNHGCYLDSNNVISFQIGSDPLNLAADPAFMLDPRLPDHNWQSIKGYQVCSRGFNNMKCEEIATDIRQNRLLPKLLSKQINMLYGHGPAVYQTVMRDGKFLREWKECPEITDWLESWPDNGIECDYKSFALSCIKNFYYFRDIFAKLRFSTGKRFGRGLPVSGLESMENRNCRLATMRQDVATSVVYYRDFRFIAVGRWNFGTSTFNIYPKFNLSEVDNYNFAAISHHREKTVDEFYGVNETHEGSKAYIQGSNSTARYINSFLKNSLAAKIHIIIPNAWIESKRTQISKLCSENKKRAKDGTDLYVFNGIEIGTEYKESTLIQFMQNELRKISKYLSGADNQGKAYASISFKDSSGEEIRWRIETVDLKYKEYIEALIAYDKRADEALLSSVGLDASISSVSKDGIISKSGADVYYNYLIYLMSLTPEDEVCSEPFNMAIKVNFPELYKSGLRIGFYRETPSRQEDTPPSNRLNQQQS